MKQLILPFLVITAFSSCKKNNVEDTPVTPLVITKADYSTNYKVGGTSYNFFTVSPASVTVPVNGENQTWNFSALAETGTSNNGGASFLTASNAVFPSATYMYADTKGWTVSGVSSPTFASNNFIELSDAGIYDLGYTQNTATNIVVASLGATIAYPAQNLNYTGTVRYPNVLFPAKFGNAAVTSNGIVSTSNYTVTAAAFGLSNTPGQTKLTTSVKIEIIGSGVANLKGIGNVRVLLQKTSRSEQTNYFLGGAPAPAALLTNLGLTDGATTTGTTYRLIGEGLGTVGLIEVNASGVVTFANFRKG
jgi:hypothetical protein